MSYLTVIDVAKHFAVSPRTVERLIERGELPAVRFGPKLLRIHPKALEAYEATLCPNIDSSDLPSTESPLASGTSHGPRRDARIVNLRAQRTR